MQIRWIPAVLIAFLWSGFTLFTVRRFWRAPDDLESLSHFQAGKWWGILVNVASAFCVPTVVQLPGLTYWTEVLYFGFIGFPFFVIGGYYFGRVTKFLIEALSRK
jgi:hypothetical protein